MRQAPLDCIAQDEIQRGPDWFGTASGESEARNRGSGKYSYYLVTNISSTIFSFVHFDVFVGVQVCGFAKSIGSVGNACQTTPAQVNRKR